MANPESGKYGDCGDGTVNIKHAKMTREDKNKRIQNSQHDT